jgi:hypothetical protein
MKISTRGNKIVFGGILAIISLCVSINSAIAGCNSQAYDKEEAIKYCTGVLNCKSPQIVVCYGRVRDWKCRCEYPKKESMKPEIKKDIDYSIKKSMDKASPKLLKE